jgi:hypothetical protein
VQGYSRKQLKEDRFVESAQSAAEWATAHQRMLIWSISSAIVIGLLIWGFISWRGRQIEQANIALGAAMRTYNAPLRPAGAPASDKNAGFASNLERAKAAEKEFQTAADKYSLTKAGKIARYMEGVAAMDAGDKDAEQKLKSAADSSDREVASLAKMALANYYRNNNRQSDAVRVYKEVADHPTDTVSKAEAQLQLAGLYETTDPQQASALYHEILKEDPTGPAAQAATARLSGGRQR